MLCVFPYLRAVNNPNEFVRVYTVMSLVESGSFRINEQVQTFGWVNDMARLKGKDDGIDHYYMVKAPGIVYAGIPGYVIFSKVVAPLIGKKYPGVNGGHVTAASKPPGTGGSSVDARRDDVVAPDEHLGDAHLRIANPVLPLLALAREVPPYVLARPRDPLRRRRRGRARHELPRVHAHVCEPLAIRGVRVPRLRDDRDGAPAFAR